jgi:hypothetical protein
MAEYSIRAASRSQSSGLSGDWTSSRHKDSFSMSEGYLT